ncbi:MAG: hypothetical protein IJP39_00385 [Bacteroidales bacterium]|nr:hypothetical protein [Bacteroidales bacterium]
MKKISIIAGLMVAATVALPGCKKEAGEPESIVPVAGRFRFEASVDATKTANSGMSTVWSADDCIGLYYSSPDAAFKACGGYKLSGEAGTTRGVFEATQGATAPEIASGESVDLYAIYPYSPQVTSPAAVSPVDGYLTVGVQGGISQSGLDDKTHLSGEACPLYGVFKGVTDLENASFTMNNLTTVIEFNVTNGTEEDIVLESLTLKATEPVVGRFFVDITGDQPKFVAADATEASAGASSEASVSVVGADPLAPGSSAHIYLPLKPYTHDETKPFEVEVAYSVEGKHFTATVQKTPNGAQCVFAPGKIKKVSIPVSKPEEVKYYTKVTSVDGLLNGTYLIVYEGDDTHDAVAFNGGLKELDALSNSVPVTIDGGKIARSDALDAASFTVSIDEGTLLSSSGSYIGVQSYSNGLKQSETASVFNPQSISVDESGNANVELVFTDGTMNLRYNYASNQLRFRYYKDSGQQPIALYLLDGSGTAAKQSAGLSYSVTEFSFNEGDTFTAPELVNPNQLSVTYSSDNESVAVVDATSGAVSIKGAGTAKITAAFPGNDLFKSGSASYTIIVKSTTIEQLTIAEFLAKSVDADIWYQLTGKITEISNTTYGNLYIEDSTGSVYVYGLTKTQQDSNDKSFASIGLSAGDVVTLVAHRSEHNGTAQAGGTVPAYYVSHTHVEIPSISVTPDSKTVMANDTELEIAITSNTDWTISGNGITAVPASGTGNGTAKLTFAARTVAGDSDPIVATVAAVSDQTVFATVTIIQHGIDYSTPSGWVLTDINDLADGDIVAIVDQTSSKAMSNDKGTGAAPSAVAVSLSADKSKLSGTVDESVQWVFGTAASGVTFKLGGSENYLYATNTNNGLRVGTNASNVFSFKNDSGTGRSYLFNVATSRYVGVYNSSDWRCYTSVNSNISATLTAFYKYYPDNTEWTLDRIAVTTDPSRTEYIVGDSFSAEGMVVTAYWVDAADAAHTREEAVANSELTITPSGALGLNDTYVTVAYKGKEATVGISVSEKGQGGDTSVSLQYTLDGTVTASGTSYTDPHALEQASVSWTVAGNVAQNPWRIGGKSITGVDRAIYSTSAIPANISRIEVTSGTSSLSSVNSLTISVHSTAEDAESGASPVASKVFSNSDDIISSTVVFEKSDAASWAGKYYRIVYNVTQSTNSNKYIQFIKAEFYGVAAN